MRLFRPIVKLSLFRAVLTAQKKEPHSLIQPLGSWVFSALSGCLMQGYSRKLRPISCRSGSWSLSWPHRGDLKSRTTSRAQRFPCGSSSPAHRIRCTFCSGTCVDESRLGGEEGGQSLQITGLDLFFCFDRFRKQCVHDVHI